MNRRQFKFGLLAVAALLGSTFSDVALAESKGKVLYAGATGSIGRIAIGLLKEQGYEVRGVTRNPARALDNYGDDYEWVRGDVRDPDEMKALAEGVDFIICSTSYTEFEGPNSPQFVDYMGLRNLVDAAKAHNVKHLVVVSGGSAGHFRDQTANPRFGYVAYWKTKGEDYLKASGVPFTIVGPTGFVDGEAGEMGVKISSRSEFRLAMVRRADVAAATVASLNNPDAMGKAFYIENNPEYDTTSWRDAFKDIKPEE